MMRLSMSPAAAGVLRAMICRSGVERDRILLTQVTSTDWQSLTFSGERHCLTLRVTGPDATAIVERMCDRLSDAELSVPNAIVADIAVGHPPRQAADGTIELTIEALTVADD
jgi:hypothetical protein